MQYGFWNRARTGETSHRACAIRLYAARKTAGLSQKEVADALGKTMGAVANGENDLVFPSLDRMMFFNRNHKID